MKFWLSGTTSIHICPLLPMRWQYTTSQNLVCMYLEIWETATVRMSDNDAKSLLLSMIFDLDLWSKRSLPMILIYWGWSWSSLMMILIFDLDQISSDLPELCPRPRYIFSGATDWERKTGHHRYYSTELEPWQEIAWSLSLGIGFLLCFATNGLAKA